MPDITITQTGDIDGMTPRGQELALEGRRLQAASWLALGNILRTAKAELAQAELPLLYEAVGVKRAAA